MLIDRNPKTATGAVVDDDLLSAARKIEIPVEVIETAVRLFIPLNALPVLEKANRVELNRIVAR